jgi:hypothetical protein
MIPAKGESIMNRSIQLIAILYIFYIMLVSHTFAMEPVPKEPWKGKFKDGTEITEGELRIILEKHNKWLNSEGKDGERANLHRADLSNAFLSQADLSDADLSEANLSFARLRKANLSNAFLDEANLSNANLHGSDLSNAFLS